MEAKASRSVTTVCMSPNSSIGSGLTACTTQITAKGVPNLILSGNTSSTTEKNPQYESENEDKCDNTSKLVKA